jgi:hypothetical protein
VDIPVREDRLTIIWENGVPVREDMVTIIWEDEFPFLRTGIILHWKINPVPKDRMSIIWEGIPVPKDRNPSIGRLFPSLMKGYLLYDTIFPSQWTGCL